MLLRAGDLLVQRVPSLRWWTLVGGSIGDIVVTEQGTPAIVLCYCLRDDFNVGYYCLDVSVVGRECRIYIKPDRLDDYLEVL